MMMSLSQEAFGRIKQSGRYALTAFAVGMLGFSPLSPAVHATPIAAEMDGGMAFADPAIYYVDAVYGSDQNSGLSSGSPFRSIAKINSLKLAPGSTVAFRAGQEWHETLTVSSSGLQGAPITYTSWGSGNQPIITAADSIGGWTAGSGSGGEESCPSPAICSGFERPSFPDWDAVSQNNDATAYAATYPVGHGSYSLAVHTTNGLDTRAAVVKRIPALYPGALYGFRFYINTPTGSLKPDSNIRVLEFVNGSRSVGFASIYTDGQGNVKSLSLYDTADNSHMVVETPLSGYQMSSWNEIELDLKASPTAGGATLYLNGTQQGATINRSNTTAWVGASQVYLGNTAWGSALAAGQTIYFDDFKTSTTDQPLGLADVGTASNLWSVAQASDPKLINFNGQVGTPVGDPSLVSATNQFAWNGSRLYVYSSTNPANTVEIPARATAVTSSGASYITLSGLEFRGAQTYDVYCGYSSNACDHWDFENDTFNAGYSNELYFQPFPGTAPSGPKVQNSVFKGGGSNGIALSGPGSSGAYIANNEFYDLSKVYNEAYSQNTWSDAIQGYSAERTDGYGTYIGYNNIHDIGIGISQNYGGGIHPDTVLGWTIEHNTVRNTNSAGIQLEKGASHAARFNLIVNGGTRTYGSGFFVRAGEGDSISNVVVENNTMYGGWWACSIQAQQNGSWVTATNVSFRRNICNGASSDTQLYADNGILNSGNQIVNNSFGVAHPWYIVANSRGVDTYAQLDAILGYTTNSISGDPLFVNLIAGLFSLTTSSPAIGLGAFPYP